MATISDYFLSAIIHRRGADRGQRDNSDCTPLNYAEQRGHMDCIKILQSYGLRRPGSAMSLASHVSVNAAIEPPTLDEHGHVVFRRPGRQFSLFGSSVSSLDRLPADGQAQPESSMVGEHLQDGHVGGEEEGSINSQLSLSAEHSEQVYFD